MYWSLYWSVYWLIPVLTDPCIGPCIDWSLYWSLYWSWQARHQDRRQDIKVLKTLHWSGCLSYRWSVIWSASDRWSLISVTSVKTTIIHLINMELKSQKQYLPAEISNWFYKIKPWTWCLNVLIESLLNQFIDQKINSCVMKRSTSSVMTSSCYQSNMFKLWPETKQEV